MVLTSWQARERRAERGRDDDSLMADELPINADRAEQRPLRLSSSRAAILYTLCSSWKRTDAGGTGRMWKMVQLL